MIDRKIMITCPAAVGPVATGFRAPIGTDISGLKHIVLWPCPACGAEHRWDGVDAYWVASAEPQAPSLWWELLNAWRRPKRP